MTCYFHIVLILAVNFIVKTWSQTVQEKCTSKSEIYTKWNLRPPNWYILNTDGSCLGNPCTIGIGGIIRNWCGQFIGAFSLEMGHITNNVAECLALYFGIKLINMLQIQQIVIQMDSQRAKGKSSQLSWRLNSIMMQCRDGLMPSRNYKLE
ncbi:hypothetical protein FRX31_023851 [Thalictrum thalictroides]|uniref:RNase H type-1 domain-containing protein n=1 Tax=Thalictrum thalictroides TaxID=46969 RepID=A0A7J6VN99_THATH|nr:hypothetical protein FRX31_023851 [Thalictrum thalictroides]